jgi:hypothetical protein
MGGVLFTKKFNHASLLEGRSGFQGVIEADEQGNMDAAEKLVAFALVGD